MSDPGKPPNPLWAIALGFAAVFLIVIAAALVASLNP